jgi:hypothetical protein
MQTLHVACSLQLEGRREVEAHASARSAPDGVPKVGRVTRIGLGPRVGSTEIQLNFVLAARGAGFVPPSTLGDAESGTSCGEEGDLKRSPHL